MLLESLESRYCMTGPMAVIAANSVQSTADISVQFSEAMNVGGVTDPTAYRLEGDNGPVTINAVTYDQSTHVAVLAVNSGTPLPGGSYSLVVDAGKLASAAGEAYQSDLDFVVPMTNSVFGKLPIRGGQGDGSFVTSEILESPRNLEHIASGDTNGDGIPDFVVSQMARNGLYLYEGVATGGYAPPREFLAGDSITDIAVADLNGDGYDDIVLANLFSSATVLLSNGSGGLSVVNYAMPDRTKAVVSGDFDEDGTVDLAFSVENTGVVAFYNVTGTGDFSNAANRATYTANTPAGLAVGDVNKDGFLDILGVSPLSASSSVTVSYGMSGRGFDRVEIAAPGINPTQVAFGDIDGDGANELVVASSPSRQVAVLKELSQPRQFAITQQLSLGNNTPTGISVVDFDHDGHGDLIVSTDNNDSRDPVSLYLGSATGLGQRQFVGVGTTGSANGIVVGEFDTLTKVGSFTVNSPPTANNDQVTVEKNRTNVVLDVLANDSFAPDTNEFLTIISVTTPNQGGVVSIAANGSNILYTPATGFIGVETFNYTISDGNGGEHEAQVTIQVTNAVDNLVRIEIRTTDSNGVPIARVAQGETFLVQILAEDLRVFPKGVYAPRLDLFYSPQISIGTPIVLGPAFPNDHSYDLSQPGVINEIGGIGGFTATGAGARIVATLTFQADALGVATLTSDPADLLPQHGVLLYQHNRFVLPEEIEFGSATIEVIAAVQAHDDSYNVDEDSVDNVLNVLDNDTNSAGTGLTIVGLSVPNRGGQAAISSDGKSVIYTSRPDFTGSEMFTYTVDDGNGATSEASIVIQVDNINDAPTAINDYAPDIPEDGGPNPINVLSNDDTASDVGEVLTVIEVSAGDQGGVVTIDATAKFVLYTPAPNFFGLETFTYTISDGNGGTAEATVTIDVVNVNDAPTAIDDNASVTKNSPATTLSLLDNDFITPDRGETLTITSVGATSSGGTVIVATDGKSVTYTPAANVTGVDTFTYVISDGNGGSAQATVTVSIAATWQNSRNQLDVDDDGHVTPLDVLLIINDLQLRGARQLPVPATPINGQWMHLDVNGDDGVSPLDALIIVNYLNSVAVTQGEGEGVYSPIPLGANAASSYNSLHNTGKSTLSRETIACITDANAERTAKTCKPNTSRTDQVDAIDGLMADGDWDSLLETMEANLSDLCNNP